MSRVIAAEEGEHCSKRCCTPYVGTGTHCHQPNCRVQGQYLPVWRRLPWAVKCLKECDCPKTLTMSEKVIYLDYVRLLFT